MTFRKREKMWFSIGGEECLLSLGYVQFGRREQTFGRGGRGAFFHWGVYQFGRREQTQDVLEQACVVSCHTRRVIHILFLEKNV